MINVNMIPNSDIPVLHCSQGDTEERKFEVALHSNGKMIDTSAIGQQTIYPVYAGGTEQILPVNESVPVTAPILADIEYPDEVRTDQEFTYRQVPSVSDGNAKIKTIYGNSIVFNQLAHKNTSSSTVAGVTYTNNDDGSWQVQSSGATNLSTKQLSDFVSVTNHVYFLKGCPSGGSDSAYSMDIRNAQLSNLSGRDYGNGVMWTATVSQTLYLVIRVASGWSGNVLFKPQLFDLTQMFGSGSEPTIQEFQSLFNLPYYQFTTGTLLSFNGTDVKTVGKNLFTYDEPTYTDTVINASGEFAPANNFNTYVFRGKNSFVFTYTKNTQFDSLRYGICVNGTWTRYLAYGTTVNIDATNAEAICLSISMVSDYILINPMLRFSSTSSTYEPYKGVITSLPVSEYFPTGMKSAGSVYDELNDSRVVTRLKRVELSTLNWIMSQTGRFRSDVIDDLKYVTTQASVPNIICNAYKVGSPNDTAIASSVDDIISVGALYSALYIKDTTYSTLESFVSAMSNVYVDYELTTPTEEEFATVSLVGENGEMAGYVEDDKLMFNCNAEISSQSGVFPVKIKLQDDDGIAYSSLIKLVVEEQP